MLFFLFVVFLFVGLLDHWKSKISRSGMINFRALLLIKRWYLWFQSLEHTSFSTSRLENSRKRNYYHMNLVLIKDAKELKGVQHIVVRKSMKTIQHGLSVVSYFGRSKLENNLELTQSVLQSQAWQILHNIRWETSSKDAHTWGNISRVEPTL